MKHRFFNQRQFSWHLNVLWVVLFIAPNTSFKKHKSDFSSTIGEILLRILAECRRVTLTYPDS